MRNTDWATHNCVLGYTVLGKSALISLWLDGCFEHLACFDQRGDPAHKDVACLRCSYDRQVYHLIAKYRCVNTKDEDVFGVLKLAESSAQK